MGSTTVWYCKSLQFAHLVEVKEWNVLIRSMKQEFLATLNTCSFDNTNLRMNSPEDVSRSLRENFGTTFFNITGPRFQRCILRVRKPSPFWDESSKGCLSCGHGVAEIPRFCYVWFFDYEFILGKYDQKMEPNFWRWTHCYISMASGWASHPGWWIPSTKIAQHCLQHRLRRLR